MLSIEDQPNSGWYFALHVALGLTAALLIALRVGWRWRQSPPAMPVFVSGWQAGAARASHALLYGAMLLMPVTAISVLRLAASP